MKKFVNESLSDFLNEEKAKSVRKTKAGRKIVLDQSTNEKAKQAIAALKKQLADAKKPGGTGMKDTKAGQDIKIKEIQDKIAKWEAKLKK